MRRLPEIKATWTANGGVKLSELRPNTGEWVAQRGPNDFLTVAEIAALLKVSVVTVYRWIQDYGLSERGRVGLRALEMEGGTIMASIHDVEKFARSTGRLK